MKLTGLHLLLTYQCNLECDHCFVWGSPRQQGTMTLETIREILRQAETLGTIDWIYFEGGEPFLYYAVLQRGAEMAAGRGFRVGVVSNGYWATSMEDALACLEPFAGLLQDLSISRDHYHGGEQSRERARDAAAAAEKLGIPIDLITIAPPDASKTSSAVGQLPAGASAVMFRGRAAERLAGLTVGRQWTEFTECPCEDLREPERVHIDPFGHVHLCQGITLGNVLEQELVEICDRYDPDRHAIVGPLLDGGPAELVRRFELPHPQRHADACHLCYETRRALRARFTDTLGPDQMYGVP